MSAAENQVTSPSHIFKFLDIVPLFFYKMEILAWNVRGSNTLGSLNNISKIINKHTLDIFFILDTKIQADICPPLVTLQFGSLRIEPKILEVIESFANLFNLVKLIGIYI